MGKLRLPGGLELEVEKPTTCSAESEVEKRALTSRSKHLEIYAAAFLKEVGSDKASQYELVEEWSEGKIRWYFRKRDTLSEIRIF